MVRASQCLLDIRDEAAVHLARIAKLFVPAARITVVVRLPDKPESDFVLGDDSLDGAIEALQRRRDANDNVTDETLRAFDHEQEPGRNEEPQP